MFPQLGIPVPPSRDDEEQAAARKFLSSVSRNEIMSVNAPGAGRQFRSGSPPNHRNPGSGSSVNVHQQARRPPAMEAPAFAPAARWHPTKEGADHEERVALRKLHGKKYTPQELQQQFHFYLEHNDKTLREKDAFRWQTLIELKDAVKAVAPEVPLAGRDNAVYEQLFKASPGKYLAKPRFFVAMRKVFGFAIANTTEASDGKALFILERCYKAFDIYERGHFDWRLFLIMYRVVFMPLVAFRDHLVFGFGVYASCGSFDGGGFANSVPASASTFLTSSATSDNPEFAKPFSQTSSVAVSEESSDGVKYGDVRDMFSALSVEPLRALLLDLVESAWLELAELSTALNIKVVSALRSGKSSNSIRLSRNQFDKLLDMSSLAPLFEAALPMGTSDPEVWTLVLEEHFSEPGLLAYIKPYRREVHASRKAKAFLNGFLTRVRRRCTATWKRWYRV